MEPEVSLEHGAKVLGHIGHAGVKGRHQAGVEGEQIQPGIQGKKRGKNSIIQTHYNGAPFWWCAVTATQQTVRECTSTSVWEQ